MSESVKFLKANKVLILFFLFILNGSNLVVLSLFDIQFLSMEKIQNCNDLSFFKGNSTGQKLLDCKLYIFTFIAFHKIILDYALILALISNMGLFLLVTILRGKKKDEGKL